MYKYITIQCIYVENKVSSFLEKYKRQPKIYIDLPSNGVYYNNTVIQDSQYTQIPIFGMNTMDEIMLKTPDALFSGQATVDVIKSCAPLILDPWNLVGFDIDYVLMAIRIATYGETMPITANCPKCNSENTADIKLPSILDSLQKHEPTKTLTLKDLTFNLRPLNYREFTDFSRESFIIEKQLVQLERAELSDEEADKQRQQLFDARTKLNLKLTLRHVATISAGEDQETNLEEIEKFIVNNDSEFYGQLQTSVQQINDAWGMPKFDMKCSNENCGNIYQTGISVDYASFFGTNSFRSRNLIS